jgi:hypothetical protein
MPLFRGNKDQRDELRRLQPTDVVAVVLSVGMVSALNLFILAATLEAFSNPITLPVGLSDNATQVLTGWGGGIIGVIGALVGFRVGRQHLDPKVQTIDDTSFRPDEDEEGYNSNRKEADRGPQKED